MFFSGGSVHPKRFTTIDSTNLQLGQTIQNVEKDVLRKKKPLNAISSLESIEPIRFKEAGFTFATAVWHTRTSRT